MQAAREVLDTRQQAWPTARAKDAGGPSTRHHGRLCDHVAGFLVHTIGGAIARQVLLEIGLERSNNVQLLVDGRHLEGLRGAVQTQKQARRRCSGSTHPPQSIDRLHGSSYTRQQDSAVASKLQSLGRQRLQSSMRIETSTLLRFQRFSASSSLGDIFQQHLKMSSAARRFATVGRRGFATKVSKSSPSERRHAGAGSRAGRHAAAEATHCQFGATSRIMSDSYYGLKNFVTSVQLCAVQRVETPLAIVDLPSRQLQPT